MLVLELLAAAFAVRDWPIAVAGNSIRAASIRLAHRRATVALQNDATRHLIPKIVISLTLDDRCFAMVCPGNELRKFPKRTETSSIHG
jgi:hypothetical protein